MFIGMGMGRPSFYPYSQAKGEKDGGMFDKAPRSRSREGLLLKYFENKQHPFQGAAHEVHNAFSGASPVEP
jgi:hypothetical protein